MLSIAQPDHSPKVKNDKANGRMHSSNRRAAQVLKMLNLTADQKNQMKDLRKEQQKKLQELENEQQLTVKEYNDRKTAIRKETKSKREAILTDQQKQKIAGMKEIQQKKKELDNTTKQVKLREKLNLTEDQSLQLKELQQKNSTQIEKIKNDSKLNDQQKAIKLREFRATTKASRDKIFTPEQMEKIKSIKAKHGQRKNTSAAFRKKEKN